VSEASRQQPQQKKPRVVLKLKNTLPIPASSAVASGSTTSNLAPLSGPSSSSHSSLKHIHLHLPARSLPRIAYPDTSYSSSSSLPLGTSSSNQTQPLEPSSFLVLGTAPASLAPPNSFCWWCGSNSPTSFSTFHLAAPSESNPHELVKLAGRSTCWSCSQWFEGKIREGGEYLEEVREMSEIQRKNWVREKMEEKGLEERRKKVVAW